jgi:hypothetical protein
LDNIEYIEVILYFFDSNPFKFWVANINP